MLAMHNPYLMQWLSTSEVPGLADRFFVPDFEGDLPFLVAGEQQLAWTALNEEHLLHGLLCGLAERDGAGRICMRKDGQETLLHLIEVLRQGFSFENNEELVVETSGLLRSQYGVMPSHAALSAGTLLAPRSMRIQADLILDLWAAAHMADSPVTRVALRKQIPMLFAGLEQGAVPKATFEVCVYMNLAVRFLQGDFSEVGSLEEFLVEEVIELIEEASLKVKVQAIAEASRDGIALTAADLHVE